MTERDYRRPAMRPFKPYVAGKPSKEVQRELGIEGPVAKLASNENPLGPSPKALEAIRSVLDRLHLYPFDDAWYFRQAIARHHGVEPSMVFAASGSVEVIELCGVVLLEPQDEVLTSERTFAIYGLAAQKAGARLVLVPTRDGYAYDLDAMAAAITPATKIIFLANPTNPTGTWFNSDEFDRFMARVPEDILVVYDEAYFHYTTAPDMPDPWKHLRAGRDLLILRTFSKSQGLAGLRVGYAVGPARVIGHVNLGRFPFNINLLAQVAGIAALEDRDHVEASRAFNQRELAFLRASIEDLDVTIPPSQANFILIDTRRDANWLFVELQKRGVIVRPMGGYGMPGAIRVNPGTHEENMLFIKAFRELMSGGGA
jgi:histidinol-phosphate aminotransferase